MKRFSNKLCQKSSRKWSTLGWSTFENFKVWHCGQFCEELSKVDHLIEVDHSREWSTFDSNFWKGRKSSQNLEKSWVTEIFVIFSLRASRMLHFPKRMYFVHSMPRFKNFFELGGPLSRVYFSVSFVPVEDTCRFPSICVMMVPQRYKYGIPLVSLVSFTPKMRIFWRFAYLLVVSFSCSSEKTFRLYPNMTEKIHIKMQ